MEFVDDDGDDIYGDIALPFNDILDYNNNYGNFSSPMINDFQKINFLNISTKNNSLL